MANWVRLTLETLEAEFPHCEVVQAWGLMHLGSEEHVRIAQRQQITSEEHLWSAGFSR